MFLTQRNHGGVPCKRFGRRRLDGSTISHGAPATATFLISAPGRPSKYANAFAIATRRDLSPAKPKHTPKSDKSVRHEHEADRRQRHEHSMQQAERGGRREVQP